jgi:transcriptional regulator with XRE-family HTH domain
MRTVELGKKIKELRLRSGVSQEELAEISQLSLRTIQRIENGETEPRGDSLKRISKALHINIEELTLPVPEKSIELKLKADKNILLLLNFLYFGIHNISFVWYYISLDLVDCLQRQDQRSRSKWKKNYEIPGMVVLNVIYNLYVYFKFKVFSLFAAS